MFRKVAVLSLDQPVDSNTRLRRTVISARKARTLLQKELKEIRRRLRQLEQEHSNVISIREVPDREAA